MLTWNKLKEIWLNDGDGAAIDKAWSEISSLRGDVVHYKTFLIAGEEKIERLRKAIGEMECSCLPHASPGNGTMCQRCELLAASKGDKG